MFELPSQVQIGYITFDVEVDQPYLNREGARRGEELMGLSESSKQRITIGEGQGPDIEADTVLHEMIHMCLQISALDINDEVARESVDDVEERVISALTGVLLDTLRRNPDMVRYLMGDTADLLSMTQEDEDD